MFVSAGIPEITPPFSKIVVLIDSSFSNFTEGLSSLVKSIEAFPKDSILLLIPSLSLSRSMLSIIPSSSVSRGQILTTTFEERNSKLEQSKTPFNL